MHQLTDIGLQHPTNKVILVLRVNFNQVTSVIQRAQKLDKIGKYHQKRQVWGHFLKLKEHETLVKTTTAKMMMMAL